MPQVVMAWLASFIPKPKMISSLNYQLPTLLSSITFSVKTKELLTVGNVDDNCILDLGFACKFMLAKGIKISHSGIYLQSLTSDSTPFIFGRLPPRFQKTRYKKIPPVDTNIYDTKISDESRFWFLQSLDYTITQPTLKQRIMITGLEFKYAVHQTNKNICDAQFGDFLRSNCYSSSIYLLTELICLIVNRVVSDQSDRYAAQSSISGLLGLIKKFSENHVTIGVSNNAKVISAMQKALNTVNSSCYRNLLSENNVDNNASTNTRAHCKLIN